MKNRLNEHRLEEWQLPIRVHGQTIYPLIMTFNELKTVVLTRPDNIDQLLYNYGYTCGQRHIINFEILQQAFYIYNYSENDRLYYLRKILRGFQDGCKAVT